jgi:putative DNA primase/helicase
VDRLDEEGRADERGFYLSGWNGNSPYTVDRIGRGLDLHVDAVCISMIGGTQPARISQYIAQMRRGARHNDGLIQRYGMLVWPDISQTWENIDRKPDHAASKTAFQVFERLEQMDWRAIGAKRDIGFGGEEEGLPYLRLSEGAHDLFVDWRAKLEKRLRSGELDPMMESHLAKFRKHVPALALIIHLADAEAGDVGDVGPIAMGQALQWAAYLETHATRTYASSGIAATEAAHAIIAKVKSRHLKAEGFRSKEVWRPQWSRLRDRDMVMAALKLLEDYDWLDAKKIEGNGRTATVYRINPKVLA